ncbi:MAG: HEAT repeat domain-containing protein [Candidatus Hydrogenedentes bacterium]|nr:HEAT repeat domain-containing protein [Candidatus Hydrogenedentota bacterium]
MNTHESKALYKEAARLAAEGRCSEALPLVDQLLEKYPSEPQLLYARAMCLTRLGQIAESWALCERLKREFNHPRAVELMAQLETETASRSKEADLAERSASARQARSKSPVTILEVMRCVKRLQSKDSDERLAAAEALGRLGDARAIDPLTEALGDANRNVRKAAAAALERLGVFEVEPHLRALQAKSAEVRLKAARALGQLGDPRAVQPLIQTLGDPDTPVRRAAVSALESLGQLGERRAIEALIRVLREAMDPVSAKNAETALMELDDERSFYPLVKTLRDKSSDASRNAATTLGDLGDPRAVDPLIEVLSNSRYSMSHREAAAEALGKLGDTRAVEPLVRTLNDRDLHMRKAAAEALGKLGDNSAVPPLIKALADRDLHVCETAAEALEKLGDPRAVGPLTKALEDGNAAAAAALAKLGGEEAFRSLTSALVNEEVTVGVRKAVVSVLEQLGDDRVFEPLIRALDDRELHVRQAAVMTLARLGDDRAVEPLIVALQDKDLHVCEAAAVALGKLGDKRAVVPLIRVVEDEEAFFGLRESAIAALGQLGDRRAVESLIRVLGDGSAYFGIRDAAAKVLGDLGDRRAVEPLLKALKAENNEAAAALRRLGVDPITLQAPAR